MTAFFKTGGARIAAMTLASGALVFVLGLTPTVHQDPVTGEPQIDLGLTPAKANYRAQSRRVARRTSRRTTRRHSYIRSLPAGCALRGAYYYCGGVHYQQVVQDGQTVYIVVTP